MSVAKVIVNLSLDKPFDYKIPDKLKDRVQIGVQVNVPFGKSTRRGYVLGIKDRSSYPSLKEIESVCETHPQIPEELLKLGRWMAEYYCCSREQAVRTLLPGAVRSGKISKKTLSYYFLPDMEQAKEFLDKKSKKAPKKASIIKTLLQHSHLTADHLLEESKSSKAVLRTMVKEELVGEEKREVLRNSGDMSKITSSAPLEPTDEQAEALKTIASAMETPDKKHVVLLHGTTGSGKTEVYLQAIAKALEEGKESIVLVPEISLTPQTVRRFRARFGEKLSVLHSGLTDGERYDEWTKVYEGKVKIAVGARSALFAPFRNLGLIIVDEEHENSYKQSEAPRYHARDVAVMRGYFEKAVVVLGSATPSFESYNNAMSGKYILAPLKKRIDDRLLPVMKIIDMRRERSDDGHLSLFSKELVQAIYERIQDGEQTIIFLNRRGYARQMFCSCGFVAECPDCSISYTYHRSRESLDCHLCGSMIPAYKICPECGSEDIRQKGLGTEKIESTAALLFPHARIARMDSDTMRKPSSYEEVLNSFKRGEIDILIGTQMIAKGLHFPKVTLVGIINADHGLLCQDFRGAERTFQLILQVAGRSGRGDVPGQVYIQTFYPLNSTLQYALKHDYEEFFEDDMDVRRQLKYPPEGHLITVHVKGKDENLVAEFSRHLMDQLRSALNPEILPSEPAPAPIERIKGKYRYMMLFRGHKMKLFRKHLRHVMMHIKTPKDIDIYADVDALSIM